MLAEYSDTANEAQVWNGGAAKWTTQQATTEELPTESTGWDVHVNGDNIEDKHRGYYHTYATEGRHVLFDDHAEEDKRSVTIEGTVAAESIEVAAAGYEFKAGSNAALKAGAHLTIRSMASLHSEVALKLSDLTLESGAELSSGQVITVSGVFHAGLQPTAATFNARNTITPASSINADLDLTGASSIILDGTVNMNGHRLYLLANTPITLNYDSASYDIPFFSNVSELLIINANGQEIELTPGSDVTEYLSVYSNEIPLQGISITYTSAGNISLSIPEPNTTTMSLLALSLLAARRRRKKHSETHE